MARDDFRSQLVDIARLALGPTLLWPFLMMALYVSLLCTMGALLYLWSASLLKDTLVWLLGPALVLYMNSATSTAKHFFRETALATVKWSVVAGFYINLVVFHLLVEITLQLWLVFLAALSAVAGLEEKTQPVKKLADVAFALTGLAVFTLVTVSVVPDWSAGEGVPNLRRLVLPVWLTLGILPFAYVIRLYARYELAFARVNITTTSRRQRQRTKLVLLATLHVRAGDISLMTGYGLRQVVEAPSFREARRAVEALVQEST